ncbi:hypothetical protein B0T10DRAFT_468079 [Thelonectria olida]|uniref:Uncharacterized protein n=1 Tax=Thelonectria olida TaxID=1576542 RepID=A0A9P8VLF7_9HYPO|nr:hypothetical protein B0T10DRAFT_468079 [Thelonectria olida]
MSAPPDTVEERAALQYFTPSGTRKPAVNNGAISFTNSGDVSKSFHNNRSDFNALLTSTYSDAAEAQPNLEAVRSLTPGPKSGLGSRDQYNIHVGRLLVSERGLSHMGCYV